MFQVNLIKNSAGIELNCRPTSSTYMDASRCLVYCNVITNTAAVFSVYAFNIKIISSCLAVDIPDVRWQQAQLSSVLELDLKLWRGVDTGHSLMELPHVPYGDKLMWKKADTSKSTRFHNLKTHNEI